MVRTIRLQENAGDLRDVNRGPQKFAVYPHSVRSHDDCMSDSDHNEWAYWLVLLSARRRSIAKKNSTYMELFRVQSGTRTPRPPARRGEEYSLRRVVPTHSWRLRDNRLEELARIRLQSPSRIDSSSPSGIRLPRRHRTRIECDATRTPPRTHRPAGE